MSSDAIASVIAKNISKCYFVYDKPSDRLKQMLFRGHRQFYREFWALKDISFTVKPGQTLGIIGRNGSGKSTLLQIICGTLSQTDGQMQTRGRVAALLELGAGFNPEFTGRENVFMNASLLGLSQEEIAARFDDIANFADIGNYIDQPVKTYSSGMYVRLAFAVIAHVNADILIIDEALAVGDAFFTQKCMRFLREFQKTGTLLFVSHDTRSVIGLCSRAIWIEKGLVIEDGPPKEVCERYLEAFYEAKQGKSSTTKFRRTSPPPALEDMKDQRIDFINNSGLRNDLHIFKFNLEGNSFGKGGAQITNVLLLDKNENPLSWIVGGETVMLRVVAEAYQDITSPIIGFLVKDHLGQAIFGDNTYLTYMDNPLFCPQGSLLQAEFVFRMPILPEGTYSITVAVAEGTQQEHVQHHWIHDVLFFKSESSMVATGLVGIPMLRIKLDLQA
jgi:ABC-type polysaccharide/polyol phosphate transport system, ATPase component